MQRYLIIDVFGTNRGHSVNFLQCLSDLLGPHVNLTIWASKSLCGALNGKAVRIPAISHLAVRGIMLRIGIVLSLWRRSWGEFDLILFTSFEELSLCCVRSRHLAKTVVLITNNLTRLTTIKRFFLGRALKKVRRILVYNQFQKDWLVSNLSVGSDKIAIIPHYAVGYSHHPSVRRRLEQREIVYLGGSRSDKLFDKFLELAKADKQRKFRYGVYGDVSLSDLQLCTIRECGINIQQGYLSRKDYFDVLLQAHFVMLLYSKHFSLKVSGIFFDAISCLTPVIASSLPSFSYFFDRYGELGVLVDPRQEKWVDLILNNDLDSRYEQFLGNAKVMKNECGHERVQDTYLGLLASIG